MEAYEGGGHAYHATMPTDALTRLRDAMKETERYGFDKARAEQQELGARCARCLRSTRHAERRRARLRGAGRGGELHRRPGHPDRQASSSHRACRPPPACRCSATSRPTSGPSASACSASTSSATSASAVQNLERALAEIAVARVGGTRTGASKRYTISRSTSTTSAPVAGLHAHARARRRAQRLAHRRQRHLRPRDSR